MLFRTIQLLEETRKIYEETIANKLRILKEEVINIEYALQWSKVGVVNSFILSEEEINEVREFLDKESFPYSDLEQALSFATIRIATDNLAIIYIINLPVIDKKNCEKLLIKPVKIHNKIIRINFEIIIKCNKEFFEVKENCKEYNNLCICNQENLIDISKTNCIPNLLSSKNHDCAFINNQHVNSVQELYPGVIFLNQFNGSVKTSNNETNELSGTYLIQFHNDTITIINKTFVSREVSHLKPLPALLQPNQNKQEIQEVLSLELMKDLHIRNLDELKSITNKGKIFFSFNMVLTIILISCLLLIAYKIFSARNRDKSNVTKVINEIKLTETTDFNKTSSSGCEFRSINDLPILNESGRFT